MLFFKNVMQKQFEKVNETVSGSGHNLTIHFIHRFRELISCGRISIERGLFCALKSSFRGRSQGWLKLGYSIYQKIRNQTPSF